MHLQIDARQADHQHHDKQHHRERKRPALPGDEEQRQGRRRDLHAVRARVGPVARHRGHCRKQIGARTHQPKLGQMAQNGRPEQGQHDETRLVPASAIRQDPRQQPGQGKQQRQGTQPCDTRHQAVKRHAAQFMRQAEASMIEIARDASLARANEQRTAGQYPQAQCPRHEYLSHATSLVQTDHRRVLAESGLIVQGYGQAWLHGAVDYAPCRPGNQRSRAQGSQRPTRCTRNGRAPASRCA